MTRRAASLACLASLLVAVPLGCGGDDGSDADLADVRLAAVVKGLDNPFFVTLRDGLVATARRDGVPIAVAAARTGLHDTAGQATELEALAADDPACLVVNPINETNLVGALARVGGDVPVVNVDSMVREAAAEAVGVELTTYVGTDNRAGGRLGADAMARLAGTGGRVAVITGMPGDVGSGLRADGFEAGARGRFEVVARIAADFERDKARRAAAELLRDDPAIDGFFAVNDLMALGVADAVDAAGRRGEVAVLGFDGIRRALAAIRRGALSATVAQYPYTMGELSVEACLAALRGDTVPDRIAAPVQVVDRGNVARAQARFPQPVEPFAGPWPE